MMNATVMYVS